MTGPARRTNNMASQPAVPLQDDSHPSSEAGEEPFSPGLPLRALSGFILALMSVSLPLIAVFTDRESTSDRLIPTALERDGSQPTSSLTVLRPGAPSGGEPSGQPSPVRLLP